MTNDEDTKVYQQFRERIDSCSDKDIHTFEVVLADVYKLEQSVITNRLKNGLIDRLKHKIEYAKLKSIPSMSNKILLKACRTERGEVQRAAQREIELRNISMAWWHSKWAICLAIIAITATIGTPFVIKYWQQIVSIIQSLIHPFI